MEMRTIQISSSRILWNAWSAGFLWLFFTVLPFLAQGQPQPPSGTRTAAEVIRDVLSRTDSPEIPGTVDVFKEGDSTEVVRGIATCMFATMDVLRLAVRNNCNLIITHEPIYYNHLDETEFYKNDPVFLEKRQYIREHGLIIWRFHDYIHSMQPDGILEGMVQKLGWKQYQVKDHPEQFVFPSTTLEKWLEPVKNTFPGTPFYVVGDPELVIRNVRLAPGSPGSGIHIQMLEEPDVDLVVSGECQQWETYEYVRDAMAMGKHKAVVFLGHVSSEENGMAFCAEWLKTFLHDIPITFIPCGTPYWAY
jgi:putative NIF3 family GTP cyclohydrolase 1 type 2